MPSLITDQVVDFFQALFRSLFFDPFNAQITDRIRRNGVERKIAEAADAASQSLTRFFVLQQLTEEKVEHILNGFGSLRARLKLDDIANPNITPEALVEKLLEESPCPQALQDGDQGAVYRVALHSVVQVLMLVGPVMAE